MPLPETAASDTAKAAATEQLREAAARDLQPTRDRLTRAVGLLHQLRGFIAGKKLELPLEMDQELSVLVREDLQARKDQTNA
jgi:hypothetical protein